MNASMNKRTENVTVAEITRLQIRERTAFAYGCARRVAPIIRAYGDADLVDEALERLRMYIGGFDDAAHGAREEVGRLTAGLDPDTEEPRLRAVIQASVSVASALETMYLDSVKCADTARSFALDAVQLVAPDELEAERDFQHDLYSEIAAASEPDLELLDRLPQPVWISAVSPSGPLLG